MALKFFDRTKQDATTTGTGTFTLSNTASDGGFRTFASVHASGDEVFYCAVDSSNSAFEVGQGTLTSGGNWTLTRDIVKSSTNSNNKVNFASAPEIFSTYPAENAAFSDTTLSNNVVETDAVFDETLTSNKALSGQFKGTLQFNKAFFTISNYEVASGQTLTVTDSADLYAVDIAAGTVMDRTADFTDDITISSNTMFSPGINAYATVTIANGVKATVSPVGTTFVNNGAGITTGGPTSWKLPPADGAANTEIVTDGKGGLIVKGAGGPGATTPSPATQVHIATFDYNSYSPTEPIQSLECMVPTSIAATPDLIENFTIKFYFLNFGQSNQANSSSAQMTWWVAPLLVAGGNPILSSPSATYNGSFRWWNGNNDSWNVRQPLGNSAKGASLSVYQGSYDCDTYGLNIFGYQGQPQLSSLGQSTSHGPTVDNNPFSAGTANSTHHRTDVCGEMNLFNTINSLDTSYNLRWSGYASTYTQDQYTVTGFTRTFGASGNALNATTTGHAQGFRLNFLPYDYSKFTGSGKTGMVGGRVEVFAQLKQSAAEITVA
tara:strand:+ start:1865 stop:3511 length:1647 start_codon:yes stop_codon:yes gene_type:complete